MKLIIGLGNPGEKYKDNRHNVGYLALDTLQKNKLPKDAVLRKSNVFMNDSGDFVNKLVGQYKLEPSNLYIIHDDLDIPLGSYKIQLGTGPKVHNGINSIEEVLGTKEFYRVRVGVDNRDPNNREIGEEYVLQDFTDEERKILDEVIEKVCKEINHLLK